MTTQPEALPAAPTEDALRDLLDKRANWTRWGADDQRGALNLITAAKRVQAARLVQDGRSVSLSMPLTPNVDGRPGAACCEVSTIDRGGGSGAALDHFSVSYHGFATTHVDALCHVWQDGVMWNGRSADEHVADDGVRWGGIENWAEGIFTRGVLADIPALREAPYVVPEEPVHGWELEAALARHGLTPGPGDALVVRSGRAEWNAANAPWETHGPRFDDPDAGGVRPGLHASCMEFIRDTDVAVLVWDMLDLTPSGYALPWSVHNVIPAFGLALLDNADLTELSQACTEAGRWEFLLTAAPLRVVGGTGSPINPVAVL
jgi:kynurenine formamidase